MGGRRISNPQIRQLLDEVLRTDADFTRFCLDSFSSTCQRFSAGMDRVEKVNLLLQLHRAGPVLSALRKAHPKEVDERMNGAQQTESDSPGDHSREQRPRSASRYRSRGPVPSGLPINRPERLCSNLLPVIRFAPSIYVAPAMHKTRESIFGKLRGDNCEKKKHIPGDWVLHGDNLLSFRDLSEAPWSSVCEAGAAEAHQTKEWAESNDPDRQREFVQLLNQTLREMLGPMVRLHREKKCFYFQAERHGDQLKVPRRVFYQSQKKQTSRDVVKKYETGDNKQYVHYQHTAFEGRFTRLGDTWYLAISPTYLYTNDGLHLFRFHEDWLSGLRRRQRNEAVLGEVYMWAQHLQTISGATLFNRQAKPIEFGELAEFSLPVGLNDRDWLAKEPRVEATPLERLIDQIGLSS